MARAYWLMKSEPNKYSWDQLVRDGRTHWDGVRNYEARNNLAAMKKGDLALYYHSNEGKEVVGIAEIVARGVSGSDDRRRSLGRRRHRPAHSPERSGDARDGQGRSESRRDRAGSSGKDLGRSDHAQGIPLHREAREDEGS